MTANEMTHVVGYGALGREIVRQLLAAGRPVTVIQRRKPADLPEVARFISADIMEREAIIVALDGASAVICALGLPIRRRCGRRAGRWR
ncbi:NAD(P)H-binding protein [Devosia sp.]|uniref:NAD(P)H-binding protein n=1 Tax=Devosia sp. TaxID=1871048 RepID=UPI003BAC0642